MPPITRIGDKSTGHDACPPVPATSGERMFTVSGSPVVRVEDSYAPHGCPSHTAHSGVLAGGAPHMSTGGKPVGRIGDPVSCGGSVAQGEGTFTVGDKGGENNRGQAFELVREAINAQTDKEKTLLFLTEIAENISSLVEMPRDRQGWSLLRIFLSRWFSGTACDDAESNPDVYWVDMDWILSYTRALSQYRVFIRESNLFSNAACETLAIILKNDGLLSDKLEYFNYTDPPSVPQSGNRPWRKWKESYYQDTSVLIVVMVDGLTASMGDFNFRALAAGYTEPLSNGGHRITIERVSVFVWDSFNFHDAEDDLHYWSCKEKAFSLGSAPNYINITNASFQDFRKKYNRGSDFMILSTPRRIDGIGPFQYETLL